MSQFPSDSIDGPGRSRTSAAGGAAADPGPDRADDTADPNDPKGVTTSTGCEGWLCVLQDADGNEETERYGGLRPEIDILQVDPGLAYGLPGVLEIREVMAPRGWSRSGRVPHGGHRFVLHLAAGVGLGGAEAYPEVFRPIGTFGADISVRAGMAAIPDVPGIGFEADPVLSDLFARLIADEFGSVTP